MTRSVAINVTTTMAISKIASMPVMTGIITAKDAKNISDMTIDTNNSLIISIA